MNLKSLLILALAIIVLFFIVKYFSTPKIPDFVSSPVPIELISAVWMCAEENLYVYYPDETRCIEQCVKETCKKYAPSLIPMTMVGWICREGLYKGVIYEIGGMCRYVCSECDKVRIYQASGPSSVPVYRCAGEEDIIYLTEEACTEKCATECK